MTDIKVAAGQRVRVVSRAFSSVPLDYSFSARAAAPGQAVSGQLEIRKSSWIIPGAVEKVPLRENNTVSAGMWNTFMSVDAVPDVDVVITTGQRGMRNLGVIVLLVIVVIGIAGVMIFASKP